MPAIYREPLCPLKALPLAAQPLWAASGGITPPSSLIPAHAPGQNPSDASVSPLYIRSLQVAASPCWELAFPDAICADPSVDAWLPTTMGPCAALARCFTQNFGLAPVRIRPAPTTPVQRLNYGAHFAAAVRQAHRPELSRRAAIPLCSGLYLCSPP